MGRALRYTYKLLRAWRDGGFKGAVKAGVDRIIQKGEAMDLVNNLFSNHAVKTANAI